MNEKLISELRGRAQELATKTFPADHPLKCLDPENNPDDKIFMDRLHESYKVFAELIVRECADIADKNSPMSYPDHGIKIKRHFGVEL